MCFIVIYYISVGLLSLLRYGIAIAIFAPIPTYMIYYTVQLMPGDLAIKQMIGDSVVVIIAALVAAFLNRDTAS